MKNFFSSPFLILFISINLFYSCIPDDENNTNPPGEEIDENLTGIWYYKDAIVNGEIIPYPYHEECGKDYIDFREDGTFVYVEIWECEEDIDASGTYTVSNETITIQYSANDIQTIKIINLTNQDLTLESNYDYNDNGEEEAVQQRFTRE